MGNNMSKKRYGNELHPVYSNWLCMVQRCENPNHSSFKNYGGKGVSISPDLRKFSDFRDYVVTLKNWDKGYSLDRIDGTKGYEKGNLRWATPSEQIANQVSSGKGFNTYTGVNYSITHKRWIARLTFKGKTLLSKVCKTEQEAVETRNQFILKHNLPHRLQEYKQQSSTTIP